MTQRETRIVLLLLCAIVDLALVIAACRDGEWVYGAMIAGASALGLALAWRVGIATEKWAERWKRK